MHKNAWKILRIYFEKNWSTSLQEEKNFSTFFILKKLAICPDIRKLVAKFEESRTVGDKR